MEGARLTVTVLVPTRGRPESIGPLLEAWAHTTVDATLVLGIDTDEEDLYSVPDGVEVEVMDPMPLVPKLNAMADRWMRRSDVIGFLGDDHRPRTGRWDRQIEAALASPGIAYGDDLLRGPALPTAVFVSSRIIRAVGYMAPPTLRHYYCDNAWRDWGLHAGCLRYLPGVVIEHLHHENGKADRDRTHRAAEAALISDEAAYLAYLHDGFTQDVERVHRCAFG